MGKCDEASVEVNMGDSASPLKQDIFVFTVPPEAPVFTPTPEEFLDPLAYINKIRPIAEKSGICKIKPPQNWQPPFAVDVDRLKFTPRIQRLNELEAITRVKLNFLDQIVKFWELQGSLLKIPTVERKPLDIYALHRVVKEAGGYDVCTTERKWSKIAVRMGHPQGKGVGTILKNHYERILFPYDLFKSAEALEVKLEKGEMTPEKANVTVGCKGRGSAQKGSPQPQADVKPPTRRWKKHNSEPELEHEGSQTEGCMGAEGGDRKKDLRRSTSAAAKTPDVDDKKSILRESPSKRRMGGVSMASCPGSLRAPRVPPNPAPSLQDKRQVSMTVNVVPAAPDTRDGAVDPLAKYICHNCGRGDIEEQMLLCDGCDDSYHTFCLMPPLGDIPKGDWRCPPCITQEVSKPTEAFGFEQAQREYSLQQFGEMADQFKSEYFNMPVHLVPTQTVEKEFWRIVSSIDEDVTVEYGADLHSMDHGSGFPTKSSKHLYAGDQEYADSSWNLNNLPLLEGSVLGHINADISGMKVPWMYVGMCFATFCWHNEDHWSYSINYMHWGEPKTWYGVPGSKAELFETTMRSAAPELFQWQPDLLHQLVTIMNPNILMHAGVPVYRTDQNAGEFVITFPRAYHAGFNQGYNFAEAVNFTPADWLKIGRECIAHYSNLRRFCVFSHDELVCKMSLEADSLEATVALATYQDMRTMLAHERKLRKGLLDWGVTEAEREAFELLPDDERQCSMCKTTCFLSAVTCPCTVHLVCLRHYTDLCQCPPHKHKLRYRYTLDELPLMLERLKRRSESFKEWADAVANALSPDTPKSCDLEGLRSHLKKSVDLKMQKSDLIRALEVAIEDAEKCVSVIHQLDLNKMRTRTRHSVDLKYRLTVEELTMFCEEIDNLACVLPEGSAVKEVLRQTLEIERTADALLVGEPGSPGGPVKIRELEACAEKGAALCIQLPKLPRIVNRLKQEKFLEEVKIHRDGYDPISVEIINRLLEQGLKIQPHCKLEIQLVYLQKLKHQVDVWEKKAQLVLATESEEKTLQETESLLTEAEEIEALLPSKQQLTVAVNQAKDWLKKVADMQSKDCYPYFSTLEAIVKKGSGIVINLYEKDMLVNALESACQWKDRTAKTFFRKNWPHGLMETLSPRTDILSNNRRLTATTGRASNTTARGNSSPSTNTPVSSTPEADHFMKNFNEERTPTQIVAAFKSAEEREISNMRDLRARNLRKDIRIPQPGVTYCLCQKRQFGLMTQCELCKEWFHSSCVNTRTSTGGTSPPPAGSTSPNAEAPNSPTSNTLQQNNPSITAQSHSNASASSRFLCPSCLRTRRPRLEIILGLLVALQKLPVRLAEGEALQCLTERAMAWQDVARSLLATRDAARAMAALTHADNLVSQAAAREKTEKIISSELRKASRNPELQHRVHQLSAASGVGSPPDSDIHNRNSSAAEHAYSASPQTLPRSPPLTGTSATAPTRLRLSPQLLHRFEDLMMEGDLLEVSMVETNHLWSVVRAARGDGRSPCGVWNERGNGRPANSAIAGNTNTANTTAAPKRPGQGPIHRRHMKRPRRNKDGLHPVKVVSVKRSRKSPPPILNSGAAAPRRTNTPAPTATNYLNRKQGMQGVPGGGSLMMKKHYLAKQERRRRGMAPKAPHSLTAQGKPSVRGRRGPHKLKKERAASAGGGGGGGSGTAGVASASGEAACEVARSGAGPQSPVSEDTSSGNMSSNDDEEDCAAHTCLRPTGKEVDWVQCDGGCEKWFHLHCVGLFKNSLKDDEDYYCEACSGVPETSPRIRSQSIQNKTEQTPSKNTKHSAAERPSCPTHRSASRDGGGLVLTCHEKMDKDEDSDEAASPADAEVHGYRPKKMSGADKSKRNSDGRSGAVNGESNGVSSKVKSDASGPSNAAASSPSKREVDED